MGLYPELGTPLTFSKASSSGFQTVNDKVLAEMNERARKQLENKPNPFSLGTSTPSPQKSRFGAVHRRQFAKMEGLDRYAKTGSLGSLSSASPKRQIDKNDSPPKRQRGISSAISRDSIAQKAPTQVAQTLPTLSTPSPARQIAPRPRRSPPRLSQQKVPDLRSRGPQSSLKSTKTSVASPRVLKTPIASPKRAHAPVPSRLARGTPPAGAPQGTPQGEGAPGNEGLVLPSAPKHVPSYARPTKASQSAGALNSAKNGAAKPLAGARVNRNARPPAGVKALLDTLPPLNRSRKR